MRNAEPAQRANPPTAAQIAEVQQTLVQLLEGKLDPASGQRAAKAPAKIIETTVRFKENADGGLATLEVETDDRSGLLLALAEALFEQKVQIMESEVRTQEDRVLDRFQIVELDGKPINAARRLEIQVAVLSGIQPVAPARTSQGARHEGKTAG